MFLHAIPAIRTDTLYTYFLKNEIPKKCARKRTSTLILPDYYEEVLAGKLEHPLSWGLEQ